MENLDCLRTTRPHFADGDNLLTGIEFIQATRQLSERNQVAANIGGFKLELIAYIKSLADEAPGSLAPRAAKEQP